MDRWMEKIARPTIRVAIKNKAQGLRIIVGPNAGFCVLAILKKKRQEILRILVLISIYMEKSKAFLCFCLY